MEIGVQEIKSTDVVIAQFKSQISFALIIFIPFLLSILVGQYMMMAGFSMLLTVAASGSLLGVGLLAVFGAWVMKQLSLQGERAINLFHRLGRGQWFFAYLILSKPGIKPLGRLKPKNPSGEAIELTKLEFRSDTFPEMLVGSEYNFEGSVNFQPGYILLGGLPFKVSITPITTIACAKAMSAKYGIDTPIPIPVGWLQDSDYHCERVQAGCGKTISPTVTDIEDMVRAFGHSEAREFKEAYEIEKSRADTLEEIIKVRLLPRLRALLARMREEEQMVGKGEEPKGLGGLSAKTRKVLFAAISVIAVVSVLVVAFVLMG